MPQRQRWHRAADRRFVPELCEVEYYRRAAESVAGRLVAHVDAPDPWYCKRGATPESLTAALLGATVTGARRRGKLLVLDLHTGRRLGLRFGMTGRLIVDGVAAIAQLEYDSRCDDPAWDRFSLTFGDGGELVVRDTRRLGGVELDPDEDALGPDAATLGAGELGAALAGGTAALKGRLLDQARVAGLGNLLTDETLWRAGIDPARPADSLGPDEVSHLAEVVRDTIAELVVSGGSHRGTLQPERRVGGRCLRCDVELERRAIGGRTTYSCARHQR